jgi:hypothetical protein
LFKKELQEYQQERYPLLSKSVVRHGKKQKERAKSKEKEYQLTKRTKAPSEKDRITKTIEACYNKSLSQADFMHRLSQQGLQSYSRGGKVTGIEGERKYRFSSLGFDERKLGELNYRDEALKGIQIFRDEKDKEKEIEVDVERDQFDDTTTDKDIKDEEKNKEDESDDVIDDTYNMETDYDIDL